MYIYESFFFYIYEVLTMGKMSKQATIPYLYAYVYRQTDRQTDKKNYKRSTNHYLYMYVYRYTCHP